MSLNVVFTWGSLPQNYCFTSPESFKNDIFALLMGAVAGGAGGLVIGPDKPGVADQNKLWARTDSNGYLEGTYLYLGVWARPHPVPPSSQQVIIWRGTPTQLWNFDGGDGTDPGASPPTDTSGAMWKVDTDFTFQTPIGVGANPFGGYDGNPATAVVLGQQIGEERHILGATEMPVHHHGINTLQTATGGGTGIFVDVDQTAGAPGANTANAGGSGGNTLSHQNLQPSLAVYFARRTNRKFFVIP